MSQTESIKIFTPATIANLSCGFDVLSLGLEALGDELILTKTDQHEVRIRAIHGADLSLDPLKNVASAVVIKMLEDLGSDQGIDLELFKGYKPGSGLGSSAASGVAAAFGLNELMGKRFSSNELLEYGRYGENVASGAFICDNVSSALFGGINLVRCYHPLDVMRLPVPEELHVVALHPQISIKTSESRAVLPEKVEMWKATAQAGNLAGLVSALYTSDYKRIGECLRDELAEPHRSALIPAYELTQEAARSAGALGGGISGSGPSMYFLCEGLASAKEVKAAVEEAYASTSIDFNIYLSKVASEGARIIS